MKKAFGVKDYWKMFLKRGPRLPLCYFIENHLFDIKHGTDTHERLPLEDYIDQPGNLKYGVLYMSSWTSIIRKSTSRVLDLIGDPEGRVDFMDVGCGKGKVLLVWAEMLSGIGWARILGIDYSDELLAICRVNLDRLGLQGISLWNKDATNVDPQDLAQTLVLYLYNPFQKEILARFLEKLEGKEAWLIYNNPVNEPVVLAQGFQKVFSSNGWHPNAHYTIYKKEQTRTLPFTGQGQHEKSQSQ